MKIYTSSVRVWRQYPLLVVIVPALVFFVLAVGVRAVPSLHSFVTTAAWCYAIMTIIGLFGVPRLYNIERARRSGIESIDEMSGIQFENRLTALFKSLGYSVVQTKKAGDYGADHVLERDGLRTVAQAKRYNDPVGIEAVYQVVGSKAHYNATRAIVVTNSTYTPAAVTLANENDVILIGRAELVELLADQAGRDPGLVGLTLLRRQLVAGARPAIKYTFGIAIVTVVSVTSLLYSVMGDPAKQKSPVRKAGRLLSNYATFATGKRIIQKRLR